MRAPVPVEMLSDNCSVYTARETRTFGRQLGLKLNRPGFVGGSNS